MSEAEQVPAAQPGSGGAPGLEPGVGDATGTQAKLNLSEADVDNLVVRARKDGASRASVAATAVVADSWRVRGAPPAHEYAALVEDRAKGTYLLVPTTKDDHDKIRLNWRKAGKEITMSLRRFLKMRRFLIDKGTALVIPCREGKTTDGKPALELVLPGARQVPIQQRSAQAPATQPVTGTATQAAAHPAPQPAAGPAAQPGPTPEQP